MRREIWFWLLTGTLLADAASARPNPNLPTSVAVAASVFNDAEVPPSVLRKARERAQMVLGGAGIDLTWLDCGSPGTRSRTAGCSDVAFPRHFSVRLLNGPKTATGETFGQSFLDEHGEGSYADVYLGPLRTSTAFNQVNEGDLLGCVIAHELGHLLLGKDSHSANGLMRAAWRAPELQLAAKGKLVFTLQEAERMRARYFSAMAWQKTQPAAALASGN